MKVPYNWLRDYVEIPYSPEELANRLTMAGVEVGDIQVFAPLDEKIVAGKIEELSLHPTNKKLQLVKVNAGDALLSVVCGAWNIKVGDLVALALPGSVLPGGMEIRVSEIKGVSSEGMLCSAAELGLDLTDGEKGILVLDEECAPGTRLADILFVNEPVLELDLTPNRADCLGLLGVAREVAAQTGGKIRLPECSVEETGRDIRELAEVKILESELCTRYTARMMEGFRIAPSPVNMQLRLLSAGIRSIYNLVDVTNYVMWETGFPMHAFDYDKLEKGRIIVRRAAPGEEIVTLDGVTRKLDPEVLVIADDRVPVGLAGVMGGENTEITTSTKRLLLEAACFNPMNIRMTARKMNLPSEASQRYEKGVDPDAAVFVQNRAVRLIQETAGGVICRGIIDNYPKPYSIPRIKLRTSKVEKVLGYSVDKEEIKDILERLSLDVSSYTENAGSDAGSDAQGASTGAVFLVNVPSFRRDLKIEEDLIEEIARLKGFDKIPSTLPVGVLTAGRPSKARRVMDKVKDTLVACGLQEIITFSFMNPRLFDELNLPADDPRRNAVKIHNPLTEEQGVLRTTLIPGMLQVMQYNFNRQIDNQLLFELGKVFDPPVGKAKLPVEKMMVALALSGKAPQNDWQVPPVAIDFYYLKGILETLLDNLGVANYRWEEAKLPLLHPSRGARLFVENQEAGFLGALHPAAAENIDLRQDIYLAELELDVFLNTASLVPSFKPLPRYPSVFRDIAFIVPDTSRAGDILQEIKGLSGAWLEDIRLFDVYRGKQMAEGQISLAFALTFRHSERTLTDKEIDEILDKIEKELSRKYKAVLRKI
ncbi:MAG: phenylalanine--tRNA ligase subunit beta [Firmicutes bacterium]|jgi:phenylalanyl-tRNA synthetase beta chain|nr:phenylalanine--tRNA ligase subunit beta [Bacillota bacterium]